MEINYLTTTSKIQVEVNLGEMKIKLLSPAKINLGLWILGKRADGFHEIFTIIQKINFSDYIEIQPAEELIIEMSIDERIRANFIETPMEKNFVYRGLKLFEKLTGIPQKWKIKIKKNIPIGGGLGGGSSNLASVLKWVNQYFNYPLTSSELKKIIGQISSDAPAFLENKVAIAKGKGEKVEFLPLENFKNQPITLLIPKGVISPTAEIYKKVRAFHYSSKEEIQEIEKLIKTPFLTFEEFLKYIKNPLGEIFLQQFPHIAKTLEILEKMCY